MVLPQACSAKYAAHAAAERLLADEVHELLEHRGALGVGDRVEDRRGVRDVADGLADRVRDRALVGEVGAPASRHEVCAAVSPYAVARSAAHVHANSAKASLSQRSSHQRIVTMLPNHMCAISCSSTLTNHCHSPVVGSGGGG